MNELITLRAVRNYGAILLSADHSPARFGDAVDDQLLPWMDVAWFVPETYRTFSETARGRTDFAHRTLTDVHESARSWFAEALMVCPWKRKEAAAALGISRAGLERRMLPYAVPWHALCDRMVLDVCAFHARRGDVKESVVAAELGCDTTTALSRRLHRLHTSWKALTRA